MPALFRLLDDIALEKAGPTDLVEVSHPGGGNPLFLPKELLEVLAGAIVDGELIHLSGPSGAAKSSIVEALAREPASFRALCRSIGAEERPLVVFPVEMTTIETQGECYFRRALKDGTTWDEPSGLVRALEEASALRGRAYPLIWLRELGRTHSAGVQSGLLNLMVRGDVALADGKRIEGLGVAWLADSNYQAEDDATHTLVVLDDAVKRRFSCNITMEWLDAEAEVEVLTSLLERDAGRLEDRDRALIANVVKLGALVRRHRSEGNMQSATPPTIYGYLAFLRRARRHRNLAPSQAALYTLLGNLSSADKNLLSSILNDVWGLKLAEGSEGSARSWM